MVPSRVYFAQILLTIFIIGVQLTRSHAWLDSVQVESKRAIGYIRAYNGRDKDADQNTYLMNSVKFPVCKTSQQSPRNSQAFPKLKAAPGDRVVGFHTENGHVSLPANAQAKSGRTYWFGTTNPTDIPTLAELLKWKDNGEEEGGPGQYYGASEYDDGLCAEPNPSAISAQRGVGPGGIGKACKDGGFVIPKGTAPGTTLTVFWLWDYSLHFGPGTAHFEWYSSCMDIDIVAPTGGSSTGGSNSGGTTGGTSGSNSGGSSTGGGNTGGNTGGNSGSTTSNGGGTGSTFSDSSTDFNAPVRAFIDYGPADAF